MSRLALNMGEQLPAPYRERLLRALFKNGRDRQTRGRMGLALGRYLKALAECVERLNRAGAESRQPWELVFLDPALVDQLRKADQQGDRAPRRGSSRASQRPLRRRGEPAWNDRNHRDTCRRRRA